MTLDKAFMLDLIPQLVAAILGTLMAVSDGMTFGWTSPMIPYYMSNASHIEITNNEANLLENLNLLGYVAGLPFTIPSVDYLGRRLSMIMSAALGCLCWFLLLIAGDISIILVSRFLAGIAGDMCCVASPMYIAEISDYRVRGFLSSITYFMMVVGIVIVYCTGSLAPYWVTPTVGIILTACQSVFVMFLPDSPYFYIYKNKHDAAKDALRRLRARANIDEELKRIQVEIAREKSEKGKLSDLILVRSNRLALYITLVLNIGQHFVGISVFLMNLQVILDEAGSNSIPSTTASITFAIIMLFSTGLASTVIDKYGRRFLLIISCSITGLALFCMSVYFHLQYNDYNVSGVSWIPAACAMLYAATFKFGLGLVPIVVTAEIFPTPLRSVGMTIADVAYVLGAVISINIYQILYDNFGLHVPLYLFTFFSFVMIIFTVFWLPETKGKTLDEIQVMLKREIIKVEESEANDQTYT